MIHLLSFLVSFLSCNFENSIRASIRLFFNFLSLWKNISLNINLLKLNFRLSLSTGTNLIIDDITLGAGSNASGVISIILDTSKNELVSSDNFVNDLLTTASANFFPTIKMHILNSHLNNFSINGSVIEYGSAEMILSHGGIYTFKALPYITSTLSCLSFNTLIKCSRFLSISIHVK